MKYHLQAALVAGVLTIAGCERHPVAPAASEDWRLATPPGASSRATLQLIPENIGYCVRNEPAYGADGSFARWHRPTVHSIDARQELTGTVLAIYGAVRFDEQGRERRGTNCVLPVSPASVGFMRAHMSGVSNRWLATLLEAGETCWLDPMTNIFECGGVICHPINTMLRSADASVRVARAPADTPSLIGGGTWSCSDGGGLSLSGQGVLTYHQPYGGTLSGSPTGGNEWTGGGGTTEPDECEDDGPATARVGLLGQLAAAMSGGGDSTSSECDPPTTPSCIAQPGIPMDTTCYRALTSAERQAIEDVLDTLVADTSEIADTTARAACILGAAMIRRQLDSSLVFGSRTDNPIGSPAPHSGQTDPITGRVHIDAWLIADAIRFGSKSGFYYGSELALTLIHEGLHVAGTRNHRGEEPYTSTPWKYMNGVLFSSSNAPPPGGLSPCVKWR